MNITFRNYDSKPLFTDDYLKVRDFLIFINSKRLAVPYYPWGAWEWQITHKELDRDNIGRYGFWEDGGTLAAAAIYEMSLGDAILIADEGYNRLKPELIAYATEALHNNGKQRILLPDGDYDYQRAAIAEGFRPTQDKWHSATLDIAALQSFSLPHGFSFVSLADNWDWRQYNRVMWRGFHPGETETQDEAVLSVRKEMLSSPMIIPELVVSVVSPEGNYASHCGVWYRPGDFYCYIEPVATDPKYRMMGLGKAAVLEAVRRSGDLGARQAVVGSGQQFYYNIGFYPIYTATWWERKNS
ncbi:MAG: GNAT family N-acetyltransferase [Clostridiales bacterium]|jgi:GNAT superfamily N-acetyltransferase|nr:GNAT family N-acetyltransferase [Clostridiales bacterium]